ncbi:MAG TPA: hypothetical protein VHF47_03765 [Acidimicrobiales bacterium]|nr:hypothetical protein [Acidimicrobiales bacterium]
MRRRRLPVARLLSAACVLAGVGVWSAPSADGLPPLRQGWWSKWQQPTATLTTLPLTVPPPPGSDPGGLTIARDAADVQAVAALEFRVDPGADATFYLDTAPGQQPPLPPSAQVLMCLATKTWTAEMNGRWVNAPTWGQCEVGVNNRAQSGFVFTLSPWMQKEDGAYDVVIVPGGNQPFVLNFKQTSDATLVPGEPPEPPPTTTTTTEPEPSTTTTTQSVVEETTPVQYTDIPGTGGGGATAMPVVTTSVPARTPTSLVAFGPPRPRLPGIPDTRAERIMAVSLLFFMAIALWWLGGNPARMPRLIGALAGEARPAVLPPAPSRGVGRFSRPRDDVRPPAL